MNTASASDSALCVIYVGFWPRLFAAVIDSLCVTLALLSLMLLLYGWAYFDLSSTQMDARYYLIKLGLPIICVMSFWLYYAATPGKMLIGATIADAKTGAKPTTQQFVVRYLGYYLSVLPLGLGLFWIGWDAKKQGWHDKLAGTVVIKTAKHSHNAN